MNPALELLGFGPDDRAVIFHADDVGMCHGADVAFLELSRRGLISCGSVMTPCPWFLEAADLARQNPKLDLGVHLTLTSEWDFYRWRPLSTLEGASGLLDEEGCFWRDIPQVRGHLNVTAAEAEFRAQVERALAAGIDVTHLDAHMYSALIPELIEPFIRMGLEYRLPVLLPRRIEADLAGLGLGDLDLSMYSALFGQLAQMGMPLVDSVIGSLTVPNTERDATYRAVLAALPPGLTYISLHPNTSGDIETIVPDNGHVRVEEYALLQDADFKAFVAEQGIHMIGFRCLRDLMRSGGV
ncbi:MAG: polysaccharide deacetylase family protein [Anaerolineae bacterium]|nr:polysaccharide deacetylase family protein [Anaerolineae bacterium]